MPRIRNILHLLLYSAAIIGYLPLAPYLSPFPRVALPLSIIFAVIAERRELLLKERPTLLLSIASFLFYAMQFSLHNVVQPAADMLAIFLAIRLVGEKSPRNFMQTLVLALFCLAASTLFDLSPGFIGYLLLLLLVFSVSMVLLTFDSRAKSFVPARKELRSIVFIALLQPLAAAPLVLMLFFVLPRTQFPLWHGLTRAGADRTGTSDSVRAGDTNSVNRSSTVVFRAEMPKQPQSSLYWRTIVLNTVRNDTWTRRVPPAEKSYLRDGRQLGYSIFLEPGRLPYLPLLNTPERIITYRGQPHDDRVFPSSGLYAGRRSYQAVSRTDAKFSATSDINRRYYLTLPENSSKRLKDLVLRAVSGKPGESEKLDAVERIFGGLNLKYAASGLPTGADAMDKFLFMDKKGHCELFALSFATALRVAGVPSRLVGGYYGGEYNEIAGYYIITEERAHVWVEAWIPGKGWVTVDPSRFAVNFEDSFIRRRSGFSLKARLFLDSLSYYWNRLVITYDFESQFIAVNRAGLELKELKRMKMPDAKGFVTALSLLVTLGALVQFLRRKPAEERLLKKFKRIMGKKHHIEIEPSTGLHEAVKGVDKKEVREFVDIFTETVYKDRRFTAEEIKELERLLKTISAN